MKVLLTLFLAICLQSVVSQPQNNPNFYSEVYDTAFNFNDIGFSYTTRSLSKRVGLPQFHYATYGMRWMNDTKPIFRGRFIPTDTLGQFASVYQAFQTFRDGTFAVWQIEGNNVGYILFDTGFNKIINLYDINVYPDVHGIAKLDDNRIAYFDNSIKPINFYNPPNILDSTIYLALGHNINILDLNDSSVTKLFDWHDMISKNMIVPEYFYEGDKDTNYIDWGHPNWIHQDYDGNIVVSWRHLGICKVSLEDGSIIWWAGLPDGLATEYGFNELNCISGDCRTRLQHHFKPISGREGEYVLFDNGDNERDSSRALFLEINESNNTIEVVNQYWFERSDFMGSVDVLNDGNFLVNVPTFGDISLQDVLTWIDQGVVQDSIGSYLKSIGSRIYFVKPSGELIAKYWTDSLNFVYSSQMRDYSNWPKIECNGDSSQIIGSVENPVWSNGMTGESVLADGSILSVRFNYGITNGFTREFNSSNCLSTSLHQQTSFKPIIYPNPVQEELHIDFLINETLTVNFQIIGMDGKIFLNEIDKTYSAGINTKIINLSKLNIPTGSYIVKIGSGDGDQSWMQEMFIKLE